MFLPVKLIFVQGTCCVLSFVRETRCMLIFLFMKLVHWFFSSWNWSCSWSFTRVLFVDLVVCLFSLVEFLHVDFSLHEPYTFIILTKIILFRKPAACWYSFVKLVAYWFFSSWNLNMDFIFPRETDLSMEHFACWFFLRRSCFVLIFVLKACKLVFPRETDFVNGTCIFSWNLLHLNFSTRETYIGFPSSWNQFCSLTLLRVEFVETVACCFCPRNILHRHFVSYRNWFCPCKFLHIDFVLGSYCVEIRKNTKGVFFLKLPTYWIISSWNLYSHFSLPKTDFVHEICCKLIFIRKTCCVLIFACEICYILIFLFAKLKYWFVSSWNSFC